MLDQLLGTHLSQSASLMSVLAQQGRMTKTQALILLYYAEAMTMTGIAL